MVLHVSSALEQALSPVRKCLLCDICATIICVTLPDCCCNSQSSQLGKTVDYCFVLDWSSDILGKQVIRFV